MENENQANPEFNQVATPAHKSALRPVAVFAAVIVAVVLVITTIVYLYRTDVASEHDTDTERVGSESNDSTKSAKLDTIEQRLREMDPVNSDKEWDAIDKEF